MQRFIIPMMLLISAAGHNIFAGEPWKGDKCIVSKGFIYKKEDVPFPSCHASTIEETGSGLVAAWFGGREERAPDVGIWVSRMEDGRWTHPVEVANGVQHSTLRYPTWNPVLFYAGRELLLFYKAGPSPREWWGELTKSTDNGKSWSSPCRLPEGIFGPVKNKPVLLGGNLLLCPSSTEDNGWRVHMEFTADNGKTWERTEALNDAKTGVIQPTILKLKDGSLEMLCRSQVSCIMSSLSSDNGRTWSDLAQTSLPNPNSGIDAVTLKDGRHLLVYNHQMKGRNILNVAVSDDGSNWKAAVLLENDSNGKEYSYPAVIQSSDGMVHITYTWNRELIRHLVIDPRLIETRAFNAGEWPEAE